MGILFLDTSTLIKRYIAEKGSAWMTAQCHASAGHTIIISQATLVEAVAAICRRMRDPNPVSRITPEECDKQVATFRQDAYRHFSVVNVTATTYTEAGNLCRSHHLRAYDAVQLACAIFISNEIISAGRSAPVFISSDDKLLNIARAEGFSVDNPNSHP